MRRTEVGDGALGGRDGVKVGWEGGSRGASGRHVVLRPAAAAATSYSSTLFSDYNGVCLLRSTRGLILAVSSPRWV